MATQHHTQREHWKPVVGYEGIYEVSDQGRVRGMERADSIGRPLSGKNLAQNVTRRGYRTVCLCRDGIRSTKRVHRLVLEAFVGPCPEGMECCHWDDNPTNNALTNLRWDTTIENARDRFRNSGYRNIGDIGRYNARKTHCPHGHEYTFENTYISPTNRRYCRACEHIRKGRAQSQIERKAA